MDENIRENLISLFERKEANSLGEIEKMEKKLDTDLNKGLSSKQLNDPKRKE